MADQIITGVTPEAISKLATAVGAKPVSVDQAAGLIKNATVTDPTKVNNQDDANTHINSDQATDFKTASATDQPATRSSVEKINDLMSSVKSAIIPSTPASVAPNLTDTYKNLRTTYGVTDLENHLNDLQATAKDLTAQFAVQKDAETGKPVAMNVIEGRVSEEQKQAQDKLAVINSQITQVTDQLKTKYNTIDTIMKYTDQDYQNASKAYDTAYSQNIQMFNTVKGIVDTDQTEQEKTQNDARANLQIIYNNLSSGATEAKSLSAPEQANITKLELQAGLPQGFYSQITSKNPKSDIVSTTTRETGGKKYADVIMRNADGSISVKSYDLGASTGTASTTEFEQKNQAFKGINTLLAGNNGKPYTTPDGTPYTDANGYLTPQGFKALVAAAREDGIARSDFVSQYADKIDTKNIDAYGLTAKERQDLGAI